jgi:uncharacterized phage-associated protein
MISFTFRPEKFVNAIAYFVANCPTVGRTKLCKLLYFADKEHLLRYGRTITGDRYYRLEHGPIPTKGLNMLRGMSGPADAALLHQSLILEKDNIRPKRKPDLKVFSKSDLKVLEEVCAKYGKYSASYLSHLSHKEPAWRKTGENEAIDFALFFEGHPEADNIKEIVESEQQSRKALAPYRAS